jgi:hypothetical protein
VLLGVALLTLVPMGRAQTPAGTQTVSQSPAGVTGTTSQPSTETSGTPVTTATAEPNVATLVKMTVEQTAPIKKGTEFPVKVSVDSVEHLAGFDFTITFDPKRIAPVFASTSGQQNTPEGTVLPGTPLPGASNLVVKTANLGAFLTSTGRTGLQCGQPALVDQTHVGVLCSLLGAPLCFGGQPGVSGSGELASVYFKSKGGGPTELQFSKTDLVLDDFDQCTVQVAGTSELPGACLPIRDAPGTTGTQVSCDPDGTEGTVVEGPTDVDSVSYVRLDGKGWAQVDYVELNGNVQPIPHRQQGTTVDLAKSSGGSALLLVVIVVVVVVAAAGVAGGGYVWYRRRPAGP